jgi:hypothetical protein
MPLPGANGPELTSEPAGVRLSPEMASFRALVLDFVRGYIARWGQSPSYGEIAAGTGSNPTRAKRAVRSLEKAGLLLRSPGTRGLSLPEEVERARRTLERAGLLPGNLSVPKPNLLPPAALTYPARRKRSKRGKRNGTSGDQAT